MVLYQTTALEQELKKVQVWDAASVSVEVAVVSRTLVLAVAPEVLSFGLNYLELAGGLAGDFNVARHRSKVITHRLADLKAAVGAFKLKLQFLAIGVVKVPDLEE